MLFHSCESVGTYSGFSDTFIIAKIHFKGSYPFENAFSSKHFALAITGKVSERKYLSFFLPSLSFSNRNYIASVSLSLLCQLLSCKNYFINIKRRGILCRVLKFMYNDAAHSKMKIKKKNLK